MHRLFAVIAFGVLSVGGVASVGAQTAPPSETDEPAAPAVVPDVQRVWLDFDPLCAETRTESTIASEIRVRLPEASVTLGAPIPNLRGWVVRWRTDVEGLCQLDVLHPEGGFSHVDLEDPTDEAEFELVASQVAWIVSMAPEPLTPEPAASETEPGPEDIVPAAIVEPSQPDAPIEEKPVETEKPEPETPKESEEPLPDTPAPIAEPTPDDPTGYELIPFKVSLVPGVYVTRGKGSGREVPQLSFNIIAGSSYGLDGVEFGFAYNHQEAFMKGVQMVMGANHVMGPADGVQLAMGANLVEGEFKSFQGAFGFNGAWGGVDGVQLAIGANLAEGSVDGYQIAIGANIAEDVDGGQIGIGASIGGKVSGIQAAFANVGDDVDGMQLGLVNIAGRVRGAQFGLINIADNSDIPIGLINIMLDQPVYFTAFTSESGFTSLGIQHGGEYLRYMYGVSVGPGGLTVPEAPETEGAPVIGVFAGVGVHSALSESWFVDLDTVAQQVSRGDVSKQSFLWTSRIVGGYQFSRRMAVFAGPTANFLWTSFEGGLGLPPGFINKAYSGAEGDADLWMWPGFQVGLRL